MLKSHQSGGGVWKHRAPKPFEKSGDTQCCRHLAILSEELRMRRGRDGVLAFAGGSGFVVVGCGGARWDSGRKSRWRDRSGE